MASQRIVPEKHKRETKKLLNEEIIPIFIWKASRYPKDSNFEG